MALLPAAPSAPPETPDETIARLTAELREARDQQAATSEILEIINRSPGDLATVFDAILEKAHTLCGAGYGGLVLRDGEEFHAVAVRGESHFAKYWQQTPVRPPLEGDAPYTLLMRGEPVVDVRTSNAYRDIPVYRGLLDVGGIRTLLTVPLRKDDDVLGAITAFRHEV